MILIVVPNALVSQIDTNKIKGIELDSPIGHSFYLEKFSDHITSIIGNIDAYLMDSSEVSYHTEADLE